jgi:FkbM family methyltransferase
VTAVFDELEAKAKADPLWTATRSALGAAEEEKQILVPANHTLSSFLTPSALMASYDGHHCEPHSEIVKVERLDDILRSDPARNVFLKMDVQGFEREVLEGAQETLKRTHAIYIELPIEHLYEGGWTFPEAIAYLDELGFTPAQFRTVSPLAGDRASAVEFDCLLRRKNEA